MKQVYNKLLRSSGLTLLLLLSTTILLVAGTNESKREFTKTLNKQYVVGPNALVELNNRHGKININTWDENKVKISVQIVVNATSEEKAQGTFDRISIDFYNSSSSVSATTAISDKSSSWFFGNDSCDEFSINYTVHMPKSGNLNVEAKYCDLYSAALEGTGNITVKYGNFKLDGFDEDSEIKLAYGDGYLGTSKDLDLVLSYGDLHIVEASDVSMEIKYGNMTIDQAGDINVESRYSNFEMGALREFRNEGKYDNVEIKSADEVIVETQYTSVHVHRLARRMDLEMSYGSARVDLIESSFNEISLDGSYTDFKIYMSDNAQCAVDLTGRYTDFRMPSSMRTSVNSEDGSSHEIQGTMGGGGNAILKARLNYGGMILGNQ